MCMRLYVYVRCVYEITCICERKIIKNGIHSIQPSAVFLKMFYLSEAACVCVCVYEILYIV